MSHPVLQPGQMHDFWAGCRRALPFSAGEYLSLFTGVAENEALPLATAFDEALSKDV